MNITQFIKYGFLLISIYFIANLIYLYFKGEPIQVASIVKLVSFAVITVYIFSNAKLKKHVQATPLDQKRKNA